MSRLDELPPDQRAVLSLLLRQAKSYAEVATLLKINQDAVRDRAHAALEALAAAASGAPASSELASTRRAQIADYLLRQQPSVNEISPVIAYLEGSAVARAWAAALATELAPLAPASLPEIPAGVFPPSSRRGGALLLAGLGVVVIVVVILIVSAGGSSHNTSSTAASTATASTAAKSTGATGGPTEDARLTLTSPEANSKAVGVVEILSEAGRHAFYIAAEHLPPSKGFFYAIWLFNSATSHEALSKSPAVGADGRLQGGALLPSNAGQYHTMLLTRETNERPTKPGPVVLSGAFSLGH
jgi:hypothetical protein